MENKKSYLAQVRDRLNALSLSKEVVDEIIEMVRTSYLNGTKAQTDKKKTPTFRK